jgi:hypothetical protein
MLEHFGKGRNSVLITKKFLMCNEFCDSINVTLILDQVDSENEPKFNAKAFHRIHIMLEHFGSGKIVFS